MSKIAHYLQEHLVGEVSVSPDVRRHFAQDASVLQLMPAMVVYPRGENDVRKTARFAWQIAERGKVIPVTARGLGSDQAGAALGNGIVMVFSAHMNRILTLDPKREFVEVEAGINYDKLQQALYTHGLFLPPYPSSAQYSTIGGAIANNASGEKSVKYGATVDYVDRLKVVLANGEIIETGRLSKKELSKKMGLSSFEGEVYRSLDGILEEHSAIIKIATQKMQAVRNSSGYNLAAVKRKDGSFDLTPLIVGSQGTLGIVTEATLAIEPHNPLSRLVMVSLPSNDNLQQVLDEIAKLRPSMMEFVNKKLIDQVSVINPNLIAGVLPSTNSAALLLVEFNDQKEGRQGKGIKQVQKIANKYHGSAQTAADMEDQEKLLAIRRSVAMMMVHSEARRKLVPVADDVAVPPGIFAEAVAHIEKIYENYGLPAAIWGHAGDGVIRAMPLLDLGQIGERQKLFKLADDTYKYVIQKGGSISASHGDGRMRAPYVVSQFGPEMHDLFSRVKRTFDPFGTLNPGVKLGTGLDELKPLMRGEYGLAHRLDHMPRT